MLSVSVTLRDRGRDKMYANQSSPKFLRMNFHDSLASSLTTDKVPSLKQMMQKEKYITRKPMCMCLLCS